MAGITVEEARDVALPPDAILLGGHTGLWRTVTGTAIFRARTPAFPALHGGELALVPLPLLRQLELRPRLDRFVTQLADARVAGIVFLETNSGDTEILAGAAAAANEHGVPVFAEPLRTSPHAGHASAYSVEAIDAALHRYLAGRREALLRRSQELQGELTALAFAGRGLPAIVERLAAIAGVPAAWEDPDLELRSWSGPPPGTPGAAAAAELPGDVPSVLRAARLPLMRWAKTIVPTAAPEVALLPLRADAPAAASPWKRLVVHFSAGGQIGGYLSLLGRNGSTDQEARLALAGAGLAASIEALRVRTVAEAQGNATASLVRDWLAGRFEHGAELAARAAQLGHSPSPPYAVVVFESEQLIPTDALGRLAQAVSPREPEAPPVLLTAIDDRRIVLLLPSVDVQAVEDSAGALHSALARLAGPRPAASPSPVPPRASAAMVTPLASATLPPADGQGLTGGAGARPIYAGIGRVALRLEDVPRAFREAQQSLAIARRLGGRHRVAYFGSLGVYRLLAAVAPTDELVSFYEDTLGPLIAHDHKSGGELMRTLEAYIACGGSPLVTAERLHAHRNTVLYRLEKIADVLGLDVRQPEQRLVLHLALRAGEVLGELCPGVLAVTGGSPPAAANGRTADAEAKTARQSARAQRSPRLRSVGSRPVRRVEMDRAAG
jgi:purine catabolism regulator